MTFIDEALDDCDGRARPAPLCLQLFMRLGTGHHLFRLCGEDKKHANLFVLSYLDGDSMVGLCSLIYMYHLDRKISKSIGARLLGSVRMRFVGLFT